MTEVLQANGFLIDTGNGLVRDLGLTSALRKVEARIDRADDLALVFPVYWWSLPAPRKG